MAACVTEIVEQWVNQSKQWRRAAWREKGSGSITRFVFCLTSLPYRTQTWPHIHRWNISRTALTWKSTGFSWEEAAPWQQEEDRCFQQWGLTQLSEFGKVEQRVKDKPYKNIIIQHLTLCSRATSRNTLQYCICKQKQKVLAKPGVLPRRETHWVLIRSCLKVLQKSSYPTLAFPLFKIPTGKASLSTIVFYTVLKTDHRLEV